MELPDTRPLGTRGNKPTHDFLSLYSHSTTQQDPRPPSQGTNCLKTHDFLQPLERGRKRTCSAKEETLEEVTMVQKPPPPAAPPPSVEHILPGGIGTYSISHISYFNQRVPKPEDPMLFTVAQASSRERNDENSNCSSFSNTASGFTLWEDPAVNKKGKTGKENLGDKPVLGNEAAAKLGKWTPSERPSQSSSNTRHDSFTTSLSSSQTSEHKNQSFLELLKSVKGYAQEQEVEEEDEFVIKKESTTTHQNQGELRVKVDGKSTDQKANTPRSKHSATEQRRRSKINDRFQMLRQLIPHSDQKRDKASFLLEVIDYIHFLQEKVQKYEGTYQGWNYEPKKLMPRRNDSKPDKSYVDQSCGTNVVSGLTLPFAPKIDEKNFISPSVVASAQNPAESDIRTATSFKAFDHDPGITNMAMPSPISLQPGVFIPVRNGVSVSQVEPRLVSNAEHNVSQPQPQLCQTNYCDTEVTATSNILKEKDPTFEGGTISISSMYSQGLLNTLTQALQTSGVDLSQASISVQIELGKQSNVRAPTTSTAKDEGFPSSSHGTTRSRVTRGEVSDQVLKKLKTSKS